MQEFSIFGLTIGRVLQWIKVINDNEEEMTYEFRRI